MKFYPNADVRNALMLLDIIGASGPDPSDPGPVVVQIDLGGKVIEASYYKGKKDPDVVSRHDIFYDIKPLMPFLERMLFDEEDFVTETGSHDMVCTLEWTICKKGK
jgi:hypothetical protein